MGCVAGTLCRERRIIWLSVLKRVGRKGGGERKREADRQRETETETEKDRERGGGPGVS